MLKVGNIDNIVKFLKFLMQLLFHCTCGTRRMQYLDHVELNLKRLCGQYCGKIINVILCDKNTQIIFITHCFDSIHFYNLTPITITLK